jgi:hypothetical protein
MRRFAVLVALSAAAPSAWADDPAPATAQEPRPAVIFIFDDSQAEQAAAISEVVAGRLNELEIEFRAERVAQLAPTARAQLDAAAAIAAAGETVAVFWCDLAPGSDALLHLTDGRGSRLLVRRLEPADLRGQAESVAIVVDGAVRALLAGGTIGVAVPPPAPPPAPAQAPAPAPPPAPPPSATDRFELGLSAAYAPAFRSPETIVSHGLFVGVDWRFSRFFSGFAAYTLSSPIEGKGELADLRITENRLSFGLAGQLETGRWAFGASLGLTLAFTALDVSGVGPGLSTVDDRSDIIVAIAPSLRAAYAAARRLTAFVDVGVDLCLNPVRYTARLGGEREVIADVWPVQPFVRLGFVVWLV